MLLGLTGGISSGKTTVSEMLIAHEAIVIDADQIAREVVLPGSSVLREIAQHFGQAILNESGRLDRKKLGAIVFADQTKRRELEKLIHPAIRETMVERMLAAKTEFPRRLIVVDVPLLYESGMENMFDQVMVVYVDRDDQLARLMEREGISAAEAEIRVKSQMSIEEKKKRADIVIDNRGTMEQTKLQVDHFVKELKRMGTVR